MHSFRYTALDARGQRLQGSLLAADESEAQTALQRQQLVLVSLQREASANKRNKSGHAKLEVLLDEIATLLEAGVPLAEAVATLAQGQERDAPLQKVLVGLRGGGSFSAALADSGLQLPDHVAQLVRSGETTGKLGAALRAAANYVEEDARFRQEARNAMLYPAVLVGSGIVATLVMFVFVVPRFAAILSNPKADLPWISKMVLGAGLWLTTHQWAAGLVVAAMVGAGVWLAGRADARAKAWELATRLPVLGPWTLHAELARWSALLAVLLESRVPLLTALAQANGTLRRERLRGQAGLVLAEVRGGKALSLALEEHAMLDAAGLNLIRVGERSGALARTVQSLARMHGNQSQQRLKRFLVLLEPLTILAISVVLGGIMISVMLAITSLTNVL
ncbi:MAG: type II secretion system F family protein [Rubrivivax sp.]|nr:MAG: type II secretion system F family protein [Rubrivivax sp.]